MRWLEGTGLRPWVRSKGAPLKTFLVIRRRLAPAQRGHGPREPSARPGPPGLHARVRAGILLDPEEEGEDQEEDREDNQEIERPPRDRLLHTERTVGQDPVHAQDSEVPVPPAPGRRV